MKTNIINVGNSKGIIIPAKFFKMIGLGKKVDLTVKDNKIILAPVVKNPRASWIAQFKEANANDDHDLLIPDVFEGENLEDWTW